MPSPLLFPHRKLLTTSQSLPPPPSPSLSLSSSSSPSSSSSVLHSDVVVVIAALVCALICLIGLTLVVRCVWLRRPPPSTPPNNDKGLNEKHLLSLPKLTFSSSNPDLPGDCPICLSEFADGEEIRVLPICAHTFHVECIDMWLSSHSSCPSCRQDIAAEDTGACKVCGADAEIGAKEREDAAASGASP